MQRPTGKIFFIAVVASLLISAILLSQARRKSANPNDRPASAVSLSDFGGGSSQEEAADEGARVTTKTRLALDRDGGITIYDRRP